MSKMLAHKLSLGLGGFFLASLLLFYNVQPAKASLGDYINNLFNKQQAEKRSKFINAGDKAVDGTFSQEPVVAGVNHAWIMDTTMLITGAGKSASVAMKEKYGQGAIADVASAIPYLFQPAATTQTYVADLLDSAHIIPKAQAQGLGFASLDPILSTWKIFRNLAYLVYVVIFLIIGLMVMFKSQMGKTAVTMQSAIPNIIISLIFVTFSYAIAGFLIDIMYVLMYLLIGMFPEAGGPAILDKGWLSLGYEIIAGDGIKSGAFKSFAESVDLFVTESLKTTNQDSTNSVVGFISGLTMGLIIAVAILVGIVKLFFELLKTYVIIVLMIAFSPLLLMLGAIPGQDVFGGWIRDIAGNLLSFPTTLLIIIVFKMFSATPGEGVQAGGFLPPFLIGRGSSGALTTLVGIGILLIMPELIKQMKTAVGVKDGLFTVLAKNMSDNFGQNFKQGSAALEVGALGAMGVGGAAYGYGKYRQAVASGGKSHYRTGISSALQGYDTDQKDAQGNPILIGGFSNTIRQYRNKTHNIRKAADQLAGRDLNTNDLAEQLKNVTGGPASPEKSKIPSAPPEAPSSGDS